MLFIMLVLLLFTFHIVDVGVGVVAVVVWQCCKGCVAPDGSPETHVDTFCLHAMFGMFGAVGSPEVSA